VNRPTPNQRDQAAALREHLKKGAAEIHLLHDAEGVLLEVQGWADLKLEHPSNAGAVLRQLADLLDPPPAGGWTMRQGSPGNMRVVDEKGEPLLEVREDCAAMLSAAPELLEAVADVLASNPPLGKNGKVWVTLENETVRKLLAAGERASRAPADEEETGDSNARE
jgi:hypothetical protein